MKNTLKRYIISFSFESVIISVETYKREEKMKNKTFPDSEQQLNHKFIEQISIFFYIKTHKKKLFSLTANYQAIKNYDLLSRPTMLESFF